MRPGQPPRAPASRSLRVLAVAQGFAATALVFTAILVDDALSSWPWLVNLIVVGVL